MRPPCPLVINITLLRLLARPGRPGGRLSLADTEHATLPLAADPPSRPAGCRRRARASAGVCTLTGTAAGVCTLTRTAAQWAAQPPLARRGQNLDPGPRGARSSVGVTGNYTAAPGPRPATGAGTGRRVSWTADPRGAGNCDKARMRLPPHELHTPPRPSSLPAGARPRPR